MKYSNIKYASPGINNFVLSCEAAHFGTLLVRDADKKDLRMKRVRSHIEAGDFFGTLATVLDLLIQEKSKVEEKENRLLQDLRDDLMFLEKNYKIEKK